MRISVAADAAAPISGRSLWQMLACTGWLGACVIGSYAAMRYDFQPGVLGPPPPHWPADTVLRPCKGQVTVLAFLHPRCGCTAATVKNLVAALQQHPGTQLIAVMFTPPEPEPAEEWQDGEYAQALRARAPGVRIVADPGGREAARFGAATSGTILVFDRQGQEVFRGGITNRRGGEEENLGLRLLVRALAEEPLPEPTTTTPVFGCSLQAADSSMSGNQGDAP